MSRIALIAFSLPVIFGLDGVAPIYGHAPTAESLWKQVLELSLVHTDDARARIEHLQEVAPEQVRKLAEMVLAEWPLDRRDKSLSQPRRVWGPNLEVAGRKAKSPIVIIIGDVSPDGLFEHLTFKVTSGNETLDKICLEAGRRTRFRPALADGRYVTRQTAITFHLEI